MEGLRVGIGILSFPNGINENKFAAELETKYEALATVKLWPIDKDYMDDEFMVECAVNVGKNSKFQETDYFKDIKTMAQNHEPTMAHG